MYGQLTQEAIASGIISFIRDHVGDHFYYIANRANELWPNRYEQPEHTAVDPMLDDIFPDEIFIGELTFEEWLGAFEECDVALFHDYEGMRWIRDNIHAASAYANANDDPAHAPTHALLESAELGFLSADGGDFLIGGYHFNLTGGDVVKRDAAGVEVHIKDEGLRFWLRIDPTKKTAQPKAKKSNGPLSRHQHVMNMALGI